MRERQQVAAVYSMGRVSLVRPPTLRNPVPVDCGPVDHLGARVFAPLQPAQPLRSNGVELVRLRASPFGKRVPYRVEWVTS